MRKLDVLILSLFVTITGMREVIAEHFMKSAAGTSPATIILHFVLSAVLLAPFVKVCTSTENPRRTPSGIRDLIVLNIATAVTYVLTYLAVWSDLGAAYTNLLDYGLTPVFGFVLAWTMLRERMQGRRILVVALALAGLALFFLSDLQVDRRGVLSVRWGLVAVAGASACGAWMYALNKRLVVNGMPDWLILAGRMPLTIVTAIVILLLTHRISEPFSHLYLFPFALMFYALPMYLVLVVFKRVSFGSFSLWLFLIPCVTLATAAIAGYANFSILRIAGASLVFLPVLADQIFGVGAKPRGGFEG